MNYFNMTYDEVLKCPFQQLLMLSKGIPKYEPKEKKEEDKEDKKTGILAFVKKHNLLKKKE